MNTAPGTSEPPGARLGAAERAAFERDGYLLIERALDEQACASLRELARREDEQFRAEPGVGPHHVLNRHDLIARDRRWLDLVDWPTTFPKVWGVLGWNIQLFHTQLIVSPPAPAGATAGGYGWHQDNNRMNLDLDTVPQPRISLKVGYFLTDLPTPGMGNLAVVPSSHRGGRPCLGPGEQPESAVEVCARAGDAVMFDRRLWHSATTNTSAQTRVLVTFGYSYRWLRPKSAMQHADLVGSVDPVRRQLLGWSTTANGYFEPTDDDVPLRSWIRERHGDDAVAD